MNFAAGSCDYVQTVDNMVCENEKNMGKRSVNRNSFELYATHCYVYDGLQVCLGVCFHGLNIQYTYIPYFLH